MKGTCNLILKYIQKDNFILEVHQKYSPKLQNMNKMISLIQDKHAIR